MTENLATLEKRIRSELDENRSIWKNRRTYHATLYNLFVIASIAMSVSITVAGIYDDGTLAAILGAILAGILALQQTFPFGEMAFFYRVGISEARILELDLDTKADTRKEVEDLEIRVETLIRMMALDIPRGQALHVAIQKMREEVRDAKKQ